MAGPCQLAGPECTAQAVQELTRLVGGTWQLTWTYRPQANNCRTHEPGYNQGYL